MTALLSLRCLRKIPGGLHFFEFAFRRGWVPGRPTQPLDVPMRSSQWIIALLALLGAAQAHQAWMTSGRLRALETTDAWARESAQLERERRSQARAQLKAQTEERDKRQVGWAHHMN